MASAPTSSASSFSPGPTTTVAQLAQQHRRLRTWVRVLLGVGAVLLLVLIYYALNRPSRVMLSGYRFRQVGVRVDKSRWILAYRDGKAEVLFQPADTTKGWQRHALGVDTAEARALALDWGGKALLVGDDGVVRVYDSLLRPMDSLQKTLRTWPSEQSRRKGYLPGSQPPLQGRMIAGDKSGRYAVIIGKNGQAFLTQDGGKNWEVWAWPAEMFPTDTLGTVALISSDQLRTSFLAGSRQRYFTLALGNVASSNGVSSTTGKWAQPLPVAIVLAGLDIAGAYWAADRLGNWVRRDTSGTNAGARFFFSETQSVVLLDSTSHFLGISPTQLFQHQIAEFQATRKRQPSSVADKKPAKGQPFMAKPKTPTAIKKTIRRPTSSGKAANITSSPAAGRAPAAKPLPSAKEPDPKQEPPAANLLQQQSNPAVQQTLPASDNQILKPGKEKPAPVKQ